MDGSYGTELVLRGFQLVGTTLKQRDGDLGWGDNVDGEGGGMGKKHGRGGVISLARGGMPGREKGALGGGGRWGGMGRGGGGS